jgi:hypothetical protein
MSDTQQPPAPAPVADVAAPAAPAPEAPKAEAKPEPQKPAPRVFARKVAAPVAEAKPEAEAKPAEPKADARKQIGDSAITRMRNKLAAAEALAEESKSLREELGHYAKKELESAPEKARKYVLSKHKDDPRAQLAELRALREAGLLEEPKPSPVEQPAANTAPPKSPPADSTDPDVVAALQHKKLAENPATYLLAASFHSKNAAAIKRGQQKLAPKN